MAKSSLELALLPLRDTVVLPTMVVPLFIGRRKSIRAVDHALQHGGQVFLAAQKSGHLINPEKEDLYVDGCIGEITDRVRLPDKSIKVMIEGRRRARITDFQAVDPTFLVQIEMSEPDEEDLESAAKKYDELLELFKGLVRSNKKVPSDAIKPFEDTSDIGRAVDMMIATLGLPFKERQVLLSFEQITPRIERLIDLIGREKEAMAVELRARAQSRQASGARKASKEGRGAQADPERDEFKNELAELEGKLGKKKMPEYARERSRRELKKLKMMSPMSAEATVVRNYLDWILALPWEEVTKDKLNIDAADRILDEDHYGLDKVKTRILEYLAVQELVGELRGPILCFVGPPGVGKTSLAKSIARATGRNYVRLSLGGVRDEAEIRGHRRTYIGAFPGKILQALRRAESSNAVILLDEIDKMSMDFRGDPSAALLEVLDPEQNNTFMDHYIDLDYDLSKVMFITTANTLHGIPAPLLDRMEIIELSGYTEFEKARIAERFLLPKQVAEHGLGDVDIRISEKAIRGLVNGYTRESGVRNLERELAAILRKIAIDVVRTRRVDEPSTALADEGVGEDVAEDATAPEDSVGTADSADGEAASAPEPAAEQPAAKATETAKTKAYRLTPAAIVRYLGEPRFRARSTETKDAVGTATGLAVTSSGGDILSIEVTLMPGAGKLTITGKLGDVMQESAHAAISYVRSRAVPLGLDRSFFQKIDVHIHVPEGAIPKDGPSAGITIATALASAFTRTAVKRQVAMTGEITLRGRVLPIGGVKEKLLAAARSGFTTVLIPAENEKDLKDVPKHVLSTLTVIPANNMDEVLDAALALDGAPLFPGGEDADELSAERLGDHAGAPSEISAP